MHDNYCGTGLTRLVDDFPSAIGLPAGSTGAGLVLAIGRDARLIGAASAAAGRLHGFDRRGVAAGLVLRVRPAAGLTICIVTEGIIRVLDGVLLVLLIEVIANAIAYHAANQRAGTDGPPFAAAERRTRSRAANSAKDRSNALIRIAAGSIAGAASQRRGAQSCHESYYYQVARRHRRHSSGQKSK